jgi:ferredoxin
MSQTRAKVDALDQSIRQFAEHPTVKRYLSHVDRAKEPITPIDTDWLRELCLKHGAADVGFVQLESTELDSEREKILECWPQTKSLVSIVGRMNRDDIRSPARSLANNEFHHAGDEVNEIARNIVRTLEERGLRAINVTMGFPMEMQKFPDRIWLVAHKLVAVAAGMGQMGIHRNVIHPKFGNFILLGTILLDAPLTSYSEPLDYNPCLSCKLCVSACPVGAIGADGYFNFSSCYTHNYREFMGGFQDWVNSVVESNSPANFSKKVTAAENASMWQSLSFGANYKAAYCMAVCPAGEDVIGQFLEHWTDPRKIDK